MSVLSSALKSKYKGLYGGAKLSPEAKAMKVAKNAYLQCLMKNKGQKGSLSKCRAEAVSRKRKPNAYINCLKANKGQKGSRAKCRAEAVARKSGVKLPAVMEQQKEKIAEKVAEKLTQNLPISAPQQEKVKEKVEEVMEKAMAEVPLKQDEKKILEMAQIEVPKTSDIILSGNGYLMGGCYDSDDEDSIHIHLGGRRGRPCKGAKKKAVGKKKRGGVLLGGVGVYGNGYKRSGRKIRKDKGKKKSNPWIKHVQMMAKKLRIPYNEAIADPRVKSSY